MNSIPLLSGGVPGLGHFWGFYRDSISFAQRGLNEHGRLFRFKLPGKDAYFLIGPEYSAHFFKASDTQLSPQKIYRAFSPIFGGVFDGDPEMFHQKMELLHPALREKAMTSYLPIIMEEANRFSDGLQHDGKFNLLQEMHGVVLRIAGRCIIGEDSQAFMSPVFSRCYRDLCNSFRAIDYFWNTAPTLIHTRRDAARKKIADRLMVLLKQRRSDISSKSDFLGVVAAARYPDGRPIPDGEAIDLLLTTFFASHATTAAAATWTGLLLAQSPTWTARVRGEAEEVFAAPIPLPAAQQEMEWCVKESERLWPPVSAMARLALTDFKIDNEIISAGSLVFLSIAVSHRLPDVFDNPNDFDPSRFSPSRAEDKHRPYALVGFGGGRHRCLGFSFSNLVIKVIWGILLRKFNFSIETTKALAANPKKMVLQPTCAAISYCRR